MKIFFAASLLALLAGSSALFGLELTTAELPVAVMNRPYMPDPLVAAGGGMCVHNGVTFRVAYGPLPDGIQLTPAGYFQGIPRKEGLYAFIVRAANSCQVTTRAYTLRVEGAPMLVTSEPSLEFFYATNAGLPAPKMFHVASNWKDMAYQCDAGGVTWLDWRPLRGRTPPEGSPLQGDPVDVYIVPDKLISGVYRVPLRCTAWQASREAIVLVTLTVEATEVKSEVKYQPVK